MLFAPVRCLGLLRVNLFPIRTQSLVRLGLAAVLACSALTLPTLAQNETENNQGISNVCVAESEETNKPITISDNQSINQYALTPFHPQAKCVHWGIRLVSH